ncbi:MAG: 30S ribosome-binding factor RbfA [Patescibacteria group bacterium]
MTERIKKINALLRDVTGKVVLEEFRPNDDRVLITVTRAEVSPTLEHATVYISVLPDATAPAVLAELKKQIYHLQQAINKKLVMRPVPKIKFEIDETEANAARIEKILQEVVE